MVRVVERLRGIDVIGLVFAAACVAEVITGVLIQPLWLKMFADFGAALPLFSLLLLRPWFVVVIGLLPVVGIAEGVARRRSERWLAVRVVIAMLVVLGLPLAFFVALYLPISAAEAQVR
jgi:lysylphosphatidylglycerol synthetase-like protein (DUF2156 family)